MSLTEKGSENRSQSKGSKKAPMAGAWNVSVARRWGELIAPPLGLVLVLCQPFRPGLGLVGQ